MTKGRQIGVVDEHEANKTDLCITRTYSIEDARLDVDVFAQTLHSTCVNQNETKIVIGITTLTDRCVASCNV